MSMSSENAKSFCELALSKGLVTDEQARAFLAQQQGGCVDPAAYFVISAILDKDQVDALRQEMESDVEGRSYLLKMHDTVLQLPQVLPPETPPVPPPEPPPVAADSYVSEEVTDLARLSANEPPPGLFKEDSSFAPSPSETRATVHRVPEKEASPPKKEGPPEPLSQTSRLVLGRYMILEELGRGGMGIVYKAHDISLNRVVALKLLKGDDFTPVEINRFLKEGRLAGGLSHPNIVTVYDTQSDKKNYYIVMEYVQGKTLDKHVEAESGQTTNSERRRIAQLTGLPSDLAETIAVQGDEPGLDQTIIATIYRGTVRDPRTQDILKIIRQVADAVQFAHERSIIHRDLKPQNVLVDRRGTAKVMDFGLAKDFAGQSMATATGTIMGTPQYMPPEQAQGDIRNLDVRSDIYSLAAITYFCFCGVPPFQGPAVFDILQKVVNEDPVPPSRIKPDMDRDLEIIILKGLAKEKDRRYQTVREFADDLDRYLRGEKIVAQAPGVAYQAKKKIRRSRKLQIAISVGLVLAVGIPTGLVYTQRLRKDKAAREARDKDRENARKYFEAARGLRGKGALDNLNKAVRIAPDWADLLLERCRLQYSMGNYAAAFKDAQAAVKESPALANYWMGRITEQTGGEDSEKKAAQYYGECGKGAKDQWYVQLAEASLLRLRGDRSSAIAKATEVIQKDDTIEEAYAIRGVAYAKDGRLQEAYDDFSKVLGLNPSSADGHVNRAGVLGGLKEYGKAIIDCDEAVKLNPDCAAAYFNRGSIQKEQGNLKACVKDWQAFLKLEPGSPYAAGVKEKLEEIGGTGEEAASADTLLDQAKEFIRTRFYDKAKDRVLKALALRPDDAVLNWYAWRLCLRQAKDTEDLVDRRRLLREAYTYEVKWSGAKDFDPAQKKELPQPFPADDLVWARVPLGIERK